MRRNKRWVLGLGLAGLVALTGTAQAALMFEGRDADNTASAACTVSGTDKCTSFYFETLDITILNDWNIGTGFWDDTAAAGSAQAIAASAGLAATGLDGWVLPTGDGDEPAGALNQYLSIWDAVGESLTGLRDQFEGVQGVFYWSGTEYFGLSSVPRAWSLLTTPPCIGCQLTDQQEQEWFAVAVRPGDVAAQAVPAPGTLALLGMGLLGLLGLGGARRPLRLQFFG